MDVKSENFCESFGDAKFSNALLLSGENKEGDWEKVTCFCDCDENRKFCENAVSSLSSSNKKAILIVAFYKVLHSFKAGLEH